MKYIIYEIGIIPQAVPFPETISHAAIARAVQEYFRQRQQPCRIVSGGFFEIGSINKVEAFGSSDSLGLTSRGAEDAAIIANELYRRSIARPSGVARQCL